MFILGGQVRLCDMPHRITGTCGGAYKTAVLISLNLFFAGEILIKTSYKSYVGIEEQRMQKNNI
jgi:hypothetical protein